MSYCPDCKQELRIGGPKHDCWEGRQREEKERLARTTCSAWRDPETDPPTKTGKILIWIEGIGPSIVNVEERWMCYWNGNDETEPTAPHEWDWWMEIPPPNSQAHPPKDG